LGPGKLKFSQERKINYRKASGTSPKGAGKTEVFSGKKNKRFSVLNLVRSLI
jgi:hypothetical protein